MSRIPGAPEPCYLIHSKPYRERSLLLTLLSLSSGRVSAVCRCSSRELSRMRALLRPFCPLECQFIRGRSELATLCSAHAAGPAREIPAPAVFCAGYVNELVYWLYRENEGSAQF
ncbi:MAG: recombination protein O N-terminal domain-containing protein, partial [Succinivibrio sp.]